jgi:ACT domain-containing protein
LNLSLTLEQPHELRISLTDISGMVIKVLTPMRAFGSGVLTQNYSVRHLPAGIYMLVIESESGEKQTQRLIIQKSDGVTD